MNLTHNGKIGRLPKAIREELNRRIENGENGGQLVEWLNSLPEVQAVMATEFGGKVVREQNLSEWRKTGYAQWLQQQEALAMARQLAAETSELQPADGQSLTDQMAVWATARYLVAVRKLAEKSEDGGLDLKVLREFCHDVVALRRGDHSGARLKLERERLEREREKTEEEVWAQFEAWGKNQQVRDCLCQDWVSPKERRRRLREIYGRPPEPEAEAAPPTPESNSVKPDQAESNQIKPDEA